MDFKSMLIGGLGTALLFVSVGAGTTQDAQTRIQVTDDPFPYEITTVRTHDGSNSATVLLNRKTGDIEQIDAWGPYQGNWKRLRTYKYSRNQPAPLR